MTHGVSSEPVYECFNCGNDADQEATFRVSGFGVVHLCAVCWPERFALGARTWKETVPIVWREKDDE